MLSKDQLDFAKAEPKKFLQQYEYLRAQAEARLGRLEYWQGCEEAENYCKELVEKVRELVTLERDISSLIDSISIKEQYKTLLYLRYIECLTISEMAQKLAYNKRWCDRLQVKALEAFAAAL